MPNLMFLILLKRWLIYRGYKVRHIQNFTDVSDETALGASKEEIDELEFTKKYEDEFLDKMKLLCNTSATKYTRASDFVQQIAEATKKLVDSNEVYQTEEGIFLKIKPEEHGKLLGVNLEESLAEKTSEVDSGPKVSPHDTLLWGPPLQEVKSGKLKDCLQGSQVALRMHINVIIRVGFAD